MTSNSNRVSGFSLIELLVVMLIAGLGLSLIGPTVFGAYEKIARSAEVQKLADVVEDAGLKCFLRQTVCTLAFEGRTLELKGFETIVLFERISFPPQTIIFNGNGYSDAEKIRYNAGDREKTLPLDWNGVRFAPG